MVVEPVPDDDSVAIIGITGSYPGARTLEELWENQKNGHDCVTEVPADRWALDDFYETDPDAAVAAGKSYCKWGGFLEGFAEFDPLFFNISPKDALDIDPQERLFLQCSWEALEDAGYTREMIAKQHGGNLGVFAGITQTGFNLYGPEWRSREQSVMPHTSFSSAANRVSYFLNAHGPSMPIDTMCSSSLVAIHEACENIRRGACEVALAGGVNLYLHPSTYVGLSAARMLSRDGCCKSFGAGGNGYVPGEGVGVVMLKRLSRAIADGDRVHAIIRATEVNHGGKTNGYTVPNPVAQAELIRKTLDKAGIDARAVSYIEAHGTGTELGDPIEITGLTQAFRKDTDDVGFCAIGSAKSNLGHLEAAAGIAGLTRIVQQMQHGQLVPSLHAEELNPNIAFDTTPFVVQRELATWAGPRIAGLSSFGAGGVNAHALLEEYVAKEAIDDAPVGPYAIVLSARNEDRLRAAAINLRRHVTSPAFLDGADCGTLRDLTFTLHTGREAMDERLAFVVDSLEALERRLTDFLDGRDDGFFRGRVETSKEELTAAASAVPIESWMQQRDFDHLLARWVEGVPMDWQSLYTGQRPRRIGLPTYPFARECYWLSSTSDADSEWLFLREAWESQPFARGIDWSERLRRQAGRRVQVIGTGEDFARVRQTLEKLQQAAAMTEAIRLGFGESFDDTPEVVLITAADTETVFNITRGLMRSAWESPICYYALYPAGGESQPYGEALVGFAGAAMMENNHHTWTLVEHDPSDRDVSGMQRLLQEWLAHDPAPWTPAPGSLFQTAPVRHVRHDGDGRHLRRRLDVALDTGADSPFRRGGTYLIAGGLGLIGADLCHELATKYRARLAILSRGPFSGERRRHAEDLERLGAAVHYYSADIADEQALGEAMTAVRRDLGELNGVIHMATSYGAGLIATREWESFRDDLRTKVKGTVNLDRATAADPLDFFMLFSSIGAFGVRGSSCHSYACAFQNAFARHRNQLRDRGERAGSATSLAWGPWTSDPIHAAADPERRARIAAEGFALNTVSGAFPLLGAACTSPEAVVGLFSVRDSDRARRRLGMAVDGSFVSSFEEHLVAWESTGRALSVDELATVISIEDIKSLPPASIDRVSRLVFPEEDLAPRATNGNLRELVCETLADVLHLQQVDDRETFQNYGMDSVSAMVFATRLERKLKCVVKPEWLIDHPSVEGLLCRLKDTVPEGLP